MPTPLKRAARYRAHAAASLANAEAAIEISARNAHLAIARHFYSLAEEALASSREMPSAQALSVADH